MGGILVVSQIKPQLEMALGRKMALSSVYKLNCCIGTTGANSHRTKGIRKAIL